MFRNVQQYRKHRGFAVVGLVAVAALAVATPTNATPNSRVGTASTGRFTATAVQPSSRVVGAKSAVGRLAVSDQALISRTDSALVNVVVKLDYDATASYTGDISGLAATSPRVTGRKLTGSSAPERAYEAYTKGIENKFRSDVAQHVTSAHLGTSLQRVYGGVAMTLPANQVKNLLKLSGVTAVQADELRKPQTDSSTTFIGAPTIWAQDGGQAMAGHGVIFGDLDTGIWPEHPSLADNPALGSPPPKADGTPRTCNFGDNPLTPAVDVFVCNHKLIGGAPFLTTYNAVVGGEVFATSARDSDGHGTHTSTTAAGDIVSSAPIFGIDRGPISGVAPGAWVAEYKVCGAQGCFSSDSAAAVEQAIIDGVNVINFSIGGGSNPYNDVVELAFLDAYDAGVLVSASAGNSGPGAATTEHVSPWVITVAASTQTRQFQSTITLTDGTTSATFVGSSLTHGVSTPSKVVLAQDIPNYEEHCLTPLPPHSADGLIVACHRGGGGGGRIEKGFFVSQGGAAGMILYNQPLADTETDNHFLPAVHLADGTDFLAFMKAHTNVMGTFTDGVKAAGQGDVMAAFSSRGPGGQFLKPDITAPGVQILAGNTPVPDAIPGGQPGQYYQAIAGTSMSSPHVAGAALLLKSLHPSWTPGDIKSALMTTATTSVVKEDLVTPADPFDFGAGRLDLTKAGAAPVVFDESAIRMFNLGNNPVTALDLNLASINVPTMPGTVTVHRTATNVTGQPYEFNVSTTAPAGTRIRVTPNHATIRPGRSLTFSITITSSAPSGQYFGEIRLTSAASPTLHLPVAFFNQQGDVTLSQSCAPATIKIGQVTSCTVTAQNNSFAPATASSSSRVTENLKVTSATGATVAANGRSASAGPAILAGQKDAIPAISLAAPGTTPAGGYFPLETFGVSPNPIGDEEALNFGVDPFVFGGKTFTTVGVVSNGYLILGGANGSVDIQCCPPQTLPDPARPNGVLAPYWSDLDGTGRPGVRVATLRDGANRWVVVQWNVGLFGVPTADGDRNMQVWIGLNGVEDVSYEYDTNAMADTPAGYGLTVGAENPSGTGGGQLTGPPALGASYVITTTPGAPGGSLTYSLNVRGTDRGTGVLTSAMQADTVAGTTITTTNIGVTRR